MFVISLFASKSYALDIHATFVNILSLDVSGVAVTSQVNSKVSLSNFPTSYAFKAVAVVVVNIILLFFESYVTLYVFLFDVIVVSPVYFKPVGN